MTSLKPGFARFHAAAPGRLHAAAHSHHPWPDVTFEAHRQAWLDAARLADDKWDHIFGTVYPRARAAVAAILGLPDPDTLVFAPNTHEFVLRLVSTLPSPLRVLTTDAEFHSFTRQMRRWEEAGLAKVDWIAAEPFVGFPARLSRAFDGHDLVFVSQVHFNSGYLVPDLEGLVTSLGEQTTIVIDGYHAFMAVPTDLGPVAERVFYLAGGYKYAMAGEGAAFLHVPAIAAERPLNTGWWAGFGALTDSRPDVPYAGGGQRFAGATADPSGVYRLAAVLEWLRQQGVTVSDIHRHVLGLQSRLLDSLPPALTSTLLPPRGNVDRGHFLTFRRADAGDLYRRAHQRDLITDFRGDRWRIGLGVYHDPVDVDRLAEIVVSIL